MSDEKETGASKEGKQKEQTNEKHKFNPDNNIFR